MYGDDYQDVRKTSNFWQPDDGVRIYRFEMYDTLVPGGSALADTIDFDGSNYVTSTRRRTLYDPFSNCFAIGSNDKSGGQDGDKVRSYFNFDANRWEVISEAWMLQRNCKPDANIAKGASGTVSIYHAETDTGYNATSVKALYAAVTSGKWCIFSIFDGTKYVLPAECPV